MKDRSIPYSPLSLKRLERGVTCLTLLMAPDRGIEMQSEIDCLLAGSYQHFFL